MRVPTAASLGSLQTQSPTADVRAALEDLLLCYSATGAAAYVPSDHGDYVRWVGVGDGTPERWTSDDDGPAIQVDGGLIAFSADAESREQRPPSVTLVSALLRGQHLEREIKHRRFQSGLDDVRLQSLYDVGLAIASTLDRSQLIEEILLRTVALLDARRGALYLFEDGEAKLAGTVGGDALDRIEATPEQFEGLSDKVESLGLLPGASHVLARPIEADCRQLGLLVAGDKESRSGVGPFSSADAPTLGLFASQAAIALENARLHREALDKERLEREMELASEIQDRLLPRELPTLDGYQFAAWSQSARHVGGDYHDLILLPGERAALLVGDVSGKGVPAALLVSTIHSALRLSLDQFGVSQELLSRLNNHIAAYSAANKFVTFFIAEVGPNGAELLYGNAGHNPALIVSSDGATRELGSGGMPLGMIAGAPYRTATAAMAVGDILCIYSDGITEAASTEGAEFGLDRLKTVLTDSKDQPVAVIVDRIRLAVESFSRGAPQADDETLLVAKRVH